MLAPVTLSRKFVLRPFELVFVTVTLFDIFLFKANTHSNRMTYSVVQNMFFVNTYVR